MFQILPLWLQIEKMRKQIAHPGNRTPVSTVGGYYDTTTPDALDISDFHGDKFKCEFIESQIP